ncbi:MAG: hypothetical protein JO023_16245 [Chloroflexi bacterium]|nr:hypothetical protein [Chloroflexota bacterium]
MASDDDDGRVLGPPDFVHLDVISAFSKLASLNTPQEYVAELRRQFPFDDNAPADVARPAIALADYGLQSTVKMAVAATDTVIDHLCGWYRRRPV